VADEDDLEGELNGLSGDLGEEIAQRWDPERLLRMVAKRAGKGERLDEATRQKYERRMGVDLSNVRIYTGELAEEVTRAHSAEAVTIGNTGMILMSGTPERSMGTVDGQALLAHELTHVAQAQRGMFFSGGPEDGAEFAKEYEEEAEQAEAAEHQEAQGSGDASASVTAAPDHAAADDAREELHRQIMERVMDMFAEEARVGQARAGGRPMRP
jgi:uncharacterized protein DUF4157